MTNELTPEQIERRNEWTRELRFGGREQTAGGLRQGEAFCALGVAADISTMRTRWVRQGEDDKYMQVQDCRGDRGVGDLTTAMVHEFGVDGETDAIIEMNDENRLTFTDIADWIDEQTIDRKGE